MQNYKLREDLSKSPERYGMRSPESLQKVRTVTMMLIRVLAQQFEKCETLPDRPDVHTGLHDLMACLIDLDANGSINENSEYYSYKTATK